MARVLVIEDDMLLSRRLRQALEQAGHQVTAEMTLKGAFHRNETEAFELMLVDLTLPDGSGLQFCRSLREKGSRIPLLIISGHVDDDSLEEGFEAGADDYLKKPFSERELLARIKCALREPLRRDEQIRIGSVLILLDQRRVMVDGKIIELKRREFDIFTYLIRNVGAVVSREKIIATLNANEDLDDRTVDSHLSHIRGRLRKSGVSKIHIHSVYGVGYRLEVA